MNILPTIPAAALTVVTLAAIAPGEQHRSTAAHNLTAEDRNQIAELGIRPLHAGGVSVRSLPIDHRDAQLRRLRELGRSSALLAPSGICDSLVAQPDGTALCTGHADGPLGSDVPMRMTLAARLEERGNGRYSFVVFNTKPLEAKAPIFGWTELVRPQGLKLSFDLAPGDDRWTATTRSGVTMTSHTDSAERLGVVLTKLDDWLAIDLARR